MHNDPYEMPINDYLGQAFSRNLGLIAPHEQQQLAKTRIAIPGLGGVGGVHLITLARLGIGAFSVAEFDIFEPANVNRQYGARFPTMGKSKLDVMVNDALEVNPHLDIRSFPEGVNSKNIDTFLEGVDLVVDSIDFFAFEHRRLIINEAKKRGIHVVTAGPIGFSCALLVFAPDKGMSFDQYFDIREGMSDIEKTIHFQMGLAPHTSYLKYGDRSYVSHREKRGPSLGLACQLCSGIAAAEAAKIILKRGPIRAAPHYTQFDSYLRKYYKGYLWMGNRNPVQRIKIAVAKRMLSSLEKSQERSKPINPDSLKNNQESALSAMVEAGIQAPSADNVQPWRFRIHDNELDILCEDNSLSCFYEYKNMPSLVACGAAIENATIAAAQYGYESQITHLPEDSMPYIASIKVTSSRQTKSPLYDVIWKRHTNRKMYSKRPLLEEAKKSLFASLKDFPDTSLHLLTSRSDIKRITSLTRKADKLRVEMKEQHEFLQNMIRFTQKEIETKRDGLPVKSLEIGIQGEMYLRLTKNWTLASALNKIGFGAIASFMASRGMEHSSAVGLITVRGTTQRDFVEGGRAMQRLWLTATSLGLDIQPMCALPIAHFRWVHEGPENFYPEHRDFLRQAFSEYEEIFSQVSFKDESEILLFRIGSGPAASARSNRKSLEEMKVD